MQTILGSGGPVAISLAKELKSYTSAIRLVSRNPKKVNNTDELYSADFRDYSQIFAAVAGSKIVYVTVGFDYKAKLWEEVWPAFMTTVIAACKAHNSKLVFFDNVYAYAEEAVGRMTERSIMAPKSRKGSVRALLCEMIMSEVNEGNLTAVIARAADFYGPQNDKSLLVFSVINNLKVGKTADWFGSLDKVHNFTYTPDAGKFTALLGNTPQAYNKIWHLPTVPATLSGKEWIEKVAGMMGVQPKMRAMPRWLFTPLGLFVPILKEFKEMLYQYENDYNFDSSAFEMYFNVKPTPIDEALRATIANEPVV